MMIETKRLRLRRWRIDDAPALFRYASDCRVSRLALWPAHSSVEMSRDVIRDVFIPNPHNFAIVLKATDEPVGCIGLVPRGGENCEVGADEMEVGYWIGYPYWGKGLTTEALRALLDYCRDELHLKSLVITTDIRNAASQRVAEKCGFRFEKNYLSDETAGKIYRLHGLRP